MSNIFNIESFKSNIENHLKREIEDYIDEKQNEIREQIEKNIRSITGKIATQIFECMDFRMDEKRLVITVDFKNLIQK